jgi:chromosome segregation protein
LSKRQEALLEEKSSGEDSNKETLDRLNNIKTEKNDAAESLEEITDRITAKRQEYISKQQEERRLAKESEELRITLGRVSARKKTIEEMESNYEGYNFAVKHVMKSGLKGIHGVVADLIKVPAGYETAMETALGAALQNIVCEDDDSAKIAINSLKQHKAGRMTFLPVKSVTGRAVRENHLKSETGFIGFGPDCLNYDSKYENIINYLLGRVIIVDSMDNAVRISKKAAGYRFVTLEGEVINAGGAITGGKYKNKTANILDRKAEITALENEIKEKEHRHNETDKALAELRNELAQFTDKLQTLENEKRKYEHDLIALNNEIRLTENILKEIKSGGDKLAKELEHIKAEKENSQNMVKELEAKIIDAQQCIVEAEQASEEAMNLYNEKKADFENINEDITQARIAVNNCDNEKAHAETMLRRINATIEEIDKDSETKRMQLNELFNEKQAITEGHGDIGSLIKQKENEKQELEEYLKDVTEEKAEIGATVIKLNAEKEAVSSKLESSRNQKYELEVKKAKNETQLDTFKDKLWEDYEISYIQAMEFKSEDFNMAAAVKENRQIRSRMKELGDVNVNAIEEYKSVKERYEFLTNERADIQEAMDALNKIIGDMDNTIKTKFKDSFDRIVINFEEKFKELFGGGHAELRLSDENDPLQASIDIVAQPPGKKLQNINLLSGGEKTLTAIALMFAVLKAKPTPFCILDEVEAPLDDANIDRFMHSLRKFAGIQFTLVTHQKATMEQADVLYGVTMPEKGVSKVLSLNLGDDFEI